MPSRTSQWRDPVTMAMTCLGNICGNCFVNNISQPEGQFKRLYELELHIWKYLNFFQTELKRKSDHQFKNKAYNDVQIFPH